MFETVSVDQALARGKRMINYPVLVIIFIPIFLSIGLVSIYEMSGWVIAGVVFLSFISAWLYWSVMITKWRIWAFDNVRNLHELKKRAIKEKLIWKDGSAFEKTEVRSAQQKEQWQALQSKFKQKDIFSDDLTVLAETPIYYSKLKAMGSIAIAVVMLGAAAYLFENETWLACFVGVMGIVVFFMGYKHLTNRDAQIILSNKGVTTAKEGFFSWADIADEDTKVVSTGKSSTTYFVFTCPDGSIEVEINELEVAQNKFESLLRIYRGRHTNKQDTRDRFEISSLPQV